MIADLFIPMLTVGLAELGDKTQLSLLLLSSKTKNHAQLLLGALCAFFLVDGSAVLAGRWITDIVSEQVIKTVSGAVFIFFGILIFLHRTEEKESATACANAFASGFLVIFLSEWGDKTQIASSLLATRYNAILVFVGVMSALAVISLITIYAGKFISHKTDSKTLTKIAGTLFIGIGLSFLLL